MSRTNPLNQKEILQAALVMADDGGMDGVSGLSMRKLAAVLGVEAMSLYNHIKNKEELVSLMVDQVVGEYQVPSVSADWRQGLETRAWSMYKTLQAHSWAVLTILPGINTGDNQFDFSNRSLALLEAGGFSLPEADKILVAVDSYTYGFVLQELTFPIPKVEYAQAARDYWNPQLETKFPVMARITALVASGEYDGINDFEYGLQALLRGLA